MSAMWYKERMELNIPKVYLSYMPVISTTLRKEGEVMLRERIAELAHLIWQQWIGYMFANFDADHIKRWTQQANTFYENLSEAEKESDRAVADRYLTAIREAAEEGMPRLGEDGVKDALNAFYGAKGLYVTGAMPSDVAIADAQRQSDIDWLKEE